MSSPSVDLAHQPNPLAPHYRAFRVSERVLLTGHSHQAWPDVAREGILESFDVAAEFVDDKWEHALQRAEVIRAALRRWFEEPDAEIALGHNTLELITRMLFSLDLERRRRIVTSSGEFHTARRLLGRLEEEGFEVIRVPVNPISTLTTRMAAFVQEKTALVLLSAVMYETSARIPHLRALAEACDRSGAELLVDAYHAIGCLRFPVAELGLMNAWITGGGYKYLQWGEGVGYLRLPPHASVLRPLLTGWFAEFRLRDRKPTALIAYPERAADRFAGATYDPASHFRAARVARFFEEHSLTPELLETNYRRQLTYMVARFQELSIPKHLARIDENLPLADRGGFLAIETPHAPQLVSQLAARGVLTDCRGVYLRLGPAPYLSDTQLETGIGILGEILAKLPRDVSRA
jgi:kynureninase